MQMQLRTSHVATTKMAFAPLTRKPVSSRKPTRTVVTKYSKYDAEDPAIIIMKQKGASNPEIWGKGAVAWLALLFAAPILLYFAYWFIATRVFGVTECYKWPLTE